MAPSPTLPAGIFCPKCGATLAPPDRPREPPKCWNCGELVANKQGPRAAGEPPAKKQGWLSRLLGKHAKATCKTENKSTLAYPEWRQVARDLNLLHPLMLKKLRTAMCFIVLDEERQASCRHDCSHSVV